MNTAGPILRDIHVAPAGWWPLAPGWWVLAALLVLVAVGVVLVIRWRARQRPLRIALHELDALAQAYARDGDAARALERASRLLRRIARRVEPEVASAAGEPWRAFVRRHARGTDAAWLLEDLLVRRFRAQPEIDVDALLHALRAWCRAALRRRGVRARRVQPVERPA